MRSRLAAMMLAVCEGRDFPNARFISTCLVATASMEMPGHSELLRSDPYKLYEEPLRSSPAWNGQEPLRSNLLPRGGCAEGDREGITGTPEHADDSDQRVGAKLPALVM
mmetsp:Transcript_45933/g.86158  ORF Transcript_45933/g.86158 Transcript_45933/m.86158 type:complete len:109 (+) Transcript_45933:46-372(+)